MEKDKKEVEAPKYSEAEEKELMRIIRLLNHAYRQRQQTYTELDDMTYDSWYIANKKAATGYIPPKINRQDVRTVSGTTREKTNTFLSAILRYNMSHSIEAFDESDIPEVDLGIALTDLVSKSRILEKYDTKRPLILNELLAQGTCFTREKYVEYKLINKIVTGETWKESDSLPEKLCETELIPGRQVFLGNIREFFLEKQPFIGVRRQIMRTEAESLYSTWKRWGDVPYLVTRSLEANLDSVPYDGFYMIEPGEDMVEEITFYDKWTNSYQILLNGVMMLSAGFPLSSLFGRIEYPISKGDLEPISSNFAYSRGIPAKTKFNQALLDEMFKAIVLKTRLSYSPPIANNTGRILSRQIFWPGTVHNNVDGSKITPIMDQRGVTGPEFSAFELIKRIIDESSVNPTFEGQASKGEQTAREIIELQKQSLMRLGLSIFGVINLEKDLVWKRMWNILKNWTDPVDVKIIKVRGQIKEQKIYRSEAVDSEFENGEMGKRIIEMTDREMPHPRMVMAEEDLLSAQRGLPVRKTYLSPEKLKSVPYRFFVKIKPIEREESELRAIMFEESITKAKTIWPGQVNDDYAKQQWAIHQKLDPDKMFLKNGGGIPGTPQIPGTRQMPGAPPAPREPAIPGPNPRLPGPTGALGHQFLPQATRKPSLTKLL